MRTTLAFYTIRMMSIVVIFLILKQLLISTHISTLLQNIHGDLHKNFAMYITRNFPLKIRDLTISILIGTSDTKLSNDIYNIFKEFNLLHVVSISGANFSLIEELAKKLSKFINLKKVYFLILIIESYYFLLIGFSNLPALRAYIFSVITIFSKLTGRPARYLDKTVLVVTIIVILIPSALSSLSLILSVGFSIFYRFLYKRPLNRIFDNELKRLTLIFLITNIIFNSKNPDFIVNIIFNVIYPFIFIGVFTNYALNNFGIESLNKLVSFVIELFLNISNQLNNQSNISIQGFYFIAILAIILFSTIRKKNHEYKAFE